MNIILSDVDGTVVKGSLVLGHASMLHDMGVIDLGDLPDQWRKNPKDEEIIYKMADAYRRQLVGKRVSDLHVKEYLDSVFQNKANFYSTYETLRAHKASGDKVYLISGSPSYLVKPLAKRIGAKGKGSVYQVSHNGRLTGKIKLMAQKEAKRHYVSKLDVQKYRSVIAYGDTCSDVPLFEVADRCYLVDPSFETQKKLSNLKCKVIR